MNKDLISGALSERVRHSHLSAEAVLAHLALLTELAPQVRLSLGPRRVFGTIASATGGQLLFNPTAGATHLSPPPETWVEASYSLRDEAYQFGTSVIGATPRGPWRLTLPVVVASETSRASFRLRPLDWWLRLQRFGADEGEARLVVHDVCARGVSVIIGLPGRTGASATGGPMPQVGSSHRGVLEPGGGPPLPVRLLVANTRRDATGGHPLMGGSFTHMSAEQFQYLAALLVEVARKGPG